MNLKALFFDLDETLCDTSGANEKALQDMALKVDEVFAGHVDASDFTGRYLRGIYRQLDQRYAERLLPVVDEGAFRLALIDMILEDLGVSGAPADNIATLQGAFDQARSQHFDFYPGVGELLLELREQYTLVVITNGPEFSQVAKVEAVQLNNYVDHIIIGGQEKEQKPAPSIFAKAMRLAQCESHETIHFGDSLAADIQGAINSDIASVWISHQRELDLSLNIEPTHILPTPLDMAAFIRRLSAQ